MMELYYSHPHPESMIVMTPSLHEYRLSQERINGTRLDKTLDYSRTFEKQRKWMRTSTGGLAGANSPFSDELHINPDDTSQSPMSSPSHQWEVSSSPRKHSSTEKPRKTISGGMDVPGQPRDVIKNGYYKEFVAASLQKRFTTESKNQRITERVERKNVNSDHEPVYKKLREDRVELNKTVPSLSPTHKTSESHSHLRNRLKSLPPPPPLVKVDKIKLKNNSQPNLHEMSKTPNSRHQEIRKDTSSERTANSSPENVRPRDSVRGFEAVQYKKARRDSIGSWDTQTNHRMDETFSMNESVRRAHINASSRSYKHFATQNVNTGEGYPLMTAQDGTVYVTMNPSLYDMNCTTHANIQAAYRDSRTLEQPSTRFQEFPILSRNCNTQISPRRKSLRKTLKQDINLQKQFEIQKLRSKEMQLGFLQAKNVYSGHEKMAQNLSNGDVIIIRDSSPPNLHNMTSQITCHPYAMQQNGEYHVQVQNQSIKPTAMKCYCQNCAYQSHIPGQRCSKEDLKRPPPLTLSKNTPPALSPSPRSSRSSTSSSLRPPPLAPPPLLSSSLSSSAPPTSSSSLLETLVKLPKHSSISSSSPNKSVQPLVSPKIPHGSFPNHSVYSTNNVPESVLVDATSIKKQQYLQTSPSSVSSMQYSPRETKILYQKVAPRAPPLLSPSAQDRNKHQQLYVPQKPQRRITYPQVAQEKDVEPKATLKRTCSEGDGNDNDSNTLSSEMLLQIPIEEEEKDVSGKSYGGFAYDHESLPIIIAVHSIAADLTQTVQNHDKRNEKTDSAGLLKQKSIEVPTSCLTTKDDSKKEDSEKSLCENAVSHQNDVKEQPPSCESTDDQVDTIQDTTTKPPSPKSTETEAPLSSSVTEEKISENVKTSESSAVATATSEEKVYSKTVIPKIGFDSKETLELSTKRPTQERSVARLSKKILETREKIKNEDIDWKKKLLCKLENILIKRLRKAEVATGVSATIDLPTSKPSDKQTKTSQKSDKKKNEGATATEGKSTDSAKQQKTNEEKLKKKHRKLKKVVAALSTEEDELSGCELTIEETQEPHDEENSTDTIDPTSKEDCADKSA